MSPQTGFSLTELMVATALLAIATAGALQAFSHAHGSTREAGTTAQLHERTQYAFATLEPELQMAGYFASLLPPAPLSVASLPDTAAQCGPDIVSRLDRPVEILEGWSLTCEARGGGAMPGSHVLIVRRAAAALSVAPEPGRAQWLSDASRPSAARIYWQGDAPWSPALVARGVELRDLVIRIFYVARHADGQQGARALRMKSLTRIAGSASFIDTEVMPGVEDLEAELLSAPPARPAVHVALRVASDPAGAVQGAPRTIEVQRHFALRNVAP